MSIYGYTNNYENSNTSQVTMEDVMNTMEKLQELERKQKEGIGCDVLVLMEEEVRKIREKEKHIPPEFGFRQPSPLFGIPVFVAKDREEFNQFILELAFRQNKKVGYIGCIWPKTDPSDGTEVKVTWQNESTKSLPEDTPTETTPTPED